MSGTTDDRIVSMHFDNAEFEKNVGSTLKSLDLLKQSLNFDQSVKALNNLDAAGKNFDLSTMSTKIEGISAKFLALSTVAITVLSNITTKALDAGLNLAKAFTIAPISQGFGDYNEKLTSVQTIMNATGQSIGTVNGYFSQLDTYSDKTIYNLKDMTGAFAKFTNAGLDMNTSVPAIKGIANMTALAGQGADAAAIAMYNLSQSIAGGFLTTMDYKSLNLANVATKEWKDQMIQGALAAGTLKKAADGTYQTLADDKKSFKGAYTDASLFTEGLSEQWATTKVLTKVLGDYGDETTAIGKKALASAQDVKSLPMMLDTLKAAVGTSWTSTFEILLGDVNESKGLFTNLTNSIQHMLDTFSDARNKLLQGWKELGGRTDLINGIVAIFYSLNSILKPIKEAFREFFPPATVKGLYDLTHSFAEFTSKLQIGADTADKVKRTFAGIFAVFDIAQEIVKGLWTLLKGIIETFHGAGGGVLFLTANLGDSLVAIDKFLVGGHKILDFVDFLVEKFRTGVDYLKHFGDNIVILGGQIAGFFGSFSPAKQVEDDLGRVNDRVSTLEVLGRKVLDIFQTVLGGIDNAIKKVWPYIRDFFANLGSTVSNSIKSGDFDAALDAINVGLLGGIVLLLKKFVEGGLKINLGGDLAKKINKMLDGITGSLKAMQQQLKAKALKEIAIAMGVLTASIFVLSLIDSDALTKALTAIAVGFGELVGTMALLDKISGSGKDNVKLTLLTAALIAIASAGVILAGAIALLGQLSWTEITHGLAGITGGLVVLVGAIKLMATEGKFTLGGALSIIAMTKALLGLAKAVKIFGEMSLHDLAQGLIGVGIALGAVVIALKELPQGPWIAVSAASMILVAVAMGMFAGVVKLFSLIDTMSLVKGIIAMTVMLELIGASINEFPPTLPLIAAGLLILGVAMTSLIAAVAIMGHMKLGTLIKGIGSMGILLGVLAIGMALMETAIPGALATIVVAGALATLTTVIGVLGNMSIGTLVKGIGAIAVTLAVLAISAALLEPLLPAMFALGIALGTIGIAFALFGVGAYLTAKAFETLAEAGKVGIGVLIATILEFLKAIPQFVGALVQALVGSAEQFLEAGDQLVGLAGKFLIKLLDLIIQLAPKIAGALVAIITSALILIRAVFPDLLQTGFDLLMQLLAGIMMHMDQITVMTVLLIARFVEGLANNVDKLVNAAIDLLMAFIKAINDRMDDITGLGLSVLIALIKGVVDNVIKVVDAVGTLVAKFIEAVGTNAQKVIDAGANLIVNFVTGLGKNVDKIVQAATDVLIAFLEQLASSGVQLANAALDILVKFLNGLAEAIRIHTPEIQAAGKNVAGAIIDGITGGLASRTGDVLSSVQDLASKAYDGFMHAIHARSPSRLFMQAAGFMAAGVAKGLDEDVTAENSAVAHAERIVQAFAETLARIPDSLEGLDASPVITPVLDLTKVQEASRNIGDLMSVAAISPDVSIDQARLISTTTDLADKGGQEPAYAGPSEVTFNQNIYSPTALSTNDIYRGTKSQIAMAKEELGI